MPRATKAALATANVVTLPTAAPRMVDNHRYADQRRAARAARDDSPFAARYQHPHDREADAIAVDMSEIKQTPELLLLSAIVRTMDADQAEQVLQQLAPGAVGGSDEHRGAHRQAITICKVSRMNIGQQFSLMRAFDRRNGAA